LRAARIMPPGYPIGEVTAFGNLMSEYRHALAGRELVRPYYFRHERMPQYRMESVLRKKLGAACERGNPLRVVGQGDRAGRRRCASRLPRKKHRGRCLEADYVVGCDGACPSCAIRPASNAADD
jgi:hypothetical protein